MHRLGAGSFLPSHPADFTATNQMVANINLTYRSLNLSAHRGRRWCSRHHALPWGQCEHATFLSIAPTLCPVQGDGWIGAFSSYVLHFLISTIVLHFIQSLMLYWSFFFQYYIIVLCLQHLYRRSEFNVEHEKSDRNVCSNKLVSSLQSNKSEIQNSLPVFSLVVTLLYDA